MLKDFHSFCQQNNIQYSLAYGSLLGAIRHNGFIPWDDDLDVFVDRLNYKMLIRALSGSEILQVERNSVDSLWVDRVRRKPALLIGKFEPTLDILILDNVPEKTVVRKIKLFLILMLQGMIKPRFHIDKGSFVLRICSVVTFLLGKLFPIGLKKRWYARASQIGNATKTSQIANYNGEYSDLKRNYPSKMMERIIEHEFEDTKVNILEDYDMCLTIEFGDYMTLPKECDRKPVHGGGE